MYREILKDARYEMESTFYDASREELAILENGDQKDWRKANEARKNYFNCLMTLYDLWEADLMEAH